jgi:DNA-binding IclR family transcriptional regulator
VPIFDSTGQISLFVSAVGFSGQFSEAALQVLAEELLQVSRVGTKWLGGNSNE